MSQPRKRVSVGADGAVEVFVPMVFRKIGGRKRVIAPLDSDSRPTTASNLNMPIIRSLARAHRWQRLLEDGTYTGMPELAKKEKISKSYVSRTLRLTLLAPDIVEAILDGRQPQSLLLDELERGFPIEWELQRRMLRHELNHPAPKRLPLRASRAKI